MKKIGLNYHSKYMKKHGLYNPEEFFKYISRLGFKDIFIQLGTESVYFLSKDSELKKIKNAKDKYKFNIVIHFPDSIDILDEKFERTYKKMINVCKVLEARYLVIHFPKSEKCVDNIITKKIYPLQPFDFRVCMENIVNGYYSDIKNTIEFVKKYPKFYLGFDIGHLNFALKGDLTKYLKSVELLFENNEKVKVIHANINDGSKDSHLPVHPSREARLVPYYLLAKEIIKHFRNKAIIIEESYPEDDYALKKMMSSLDLLSKNEL